MMIRPSQNLLSRSAALSFSSLSEDQIAFDSTLEGFTREASKPLSLLSLTAGSLSFKLAELAFLRGATLTGLSRLAPTWALHAPKFLFALGIEVSVYRSVRQNLNTFFLSEAGPSQTWASTFLDFFSLKIFGKLTQGQNAFFSHFIQANAMVLAQEASAQIGWSDATERSYLQRLSEAAALNLSLSTGLSLLRNFSGAKIHLLERQLDAQIQSSTSPMSISRRVPAFQAQIVENSAERSWKELSEGEFEESLLREKLPAVLARAQNIFDINSRDVAITDLYVMSQYFAQRGNTTNAFEAEMNQREGALREHIATLLEGHSPVTESLGEIRRALSRRSAQENERFAFSFLEMALHSETGAFLFLFMARAALAHTPLSWAELLESRSRHRSPYERSALDFLKHHEGRPVSLDRYFNFLMYGSPESVYSGSHAHKLIHEDFGNFTTISEFPYFHHFYAYKALETWRRLGKPQSFTVIEMGAGTGRLAKGILSSVRDFSAQDADFAALNEALHYKILEISPELARIQTFQLVDFSDKVEVTNGSACHEGGAFFEKPIENGMIISVELLDMFPPRALRRRASEILELHFKEQDGRIQKTYEPMSEDSQAYLARHPLPENWEGNFDYPIHPSIEVWLRNSRRLLKRGFIFTIDYGSDRARLIQPPSPIFPRVRSYPRIPEREYWAGIRELLQSPFSELYRHGFRTYIHSLSGLLLKSDITAEVDFTAVSEAAGAIPGFTLPGGPFKTVRHVMNDMAASQNTFKTSTSYQRSMSAHFPRDLIFHEIEVNPE